MRLAPSSNFCLANRKKVLSPTDYHIDTDLLLCWNVCLIFITNDDSDINPLFLSIYLTRPSKGPINI